MLNWNIGDRNIAWQNIKPGIIEVRRLNWNSSSELGGVSNFRGELLLTLHLPETENVIF